MAQQFRIYRGPSLLALNMSLLSFIEDDSGYQKSVQFDFVLGEQPRWLETADMTLLISGLEKIPGPGRDVRFVGYSFVDNPGEDRKWRKVTGTYSVITRKGFVQETQ